MVPGGGGLPDRHVEAREHPRLHRRRQQGWVSFTGAGGLMPTRVCLIYCWANDNKGGSHLLALAG